MEITYGEILCIFLRAEQILQLKHNGELELEGCWSDHHHLQKGQDDFLLVISQVQRGPCLLLPEISALSCHLKFPDFCFRIFFILTSLFYHLILWACHGAVRASGSHQPSEEKGSSRVLPHSLAVSSEIRAEAAQQGHSKRGVGWQGDEHSGKGKIATQTSRSSAGASSYLPSCHLPLGFPCDRSCYWNWGQFRGH